MLNSLYSKFGMKEVKNNLKIVSPQTVYNFSKNYNFSILSQLINGKVLFKYSNRISQELRSSLKINTYLL